MGLYFFFYQELFLRAYLNVNHFRSSLSYQLQHKYRSGFLTLVVHLSLLLVFFIYYFFIKN